MLATQKHTDGDLEMLNVRGLLPVDRAPSTELPSRLPSTPHNLPFTDRLFLIGASPLVVFYPRKLGGQVTLASISRLGRA